MIRFIIIFFVLSSFVSLAQTKEIPFTLDDRDRIIKTELKVESLRNEMNTRFEAVEMKIDAMEMKFDAKFENQQRQLEIIQTQFYWGFGILISLFLFMMGYMIWDRRTAMHTRFRKKPPN